MKDWGKNSLCCVIRGKWARHCESAADKISGHSHSWHQEDGTHYMNVHVVRYACNLTSLHVDMADIIHIFKCLLLLCYSFVSSFLEGLAFVLANSIYMVVPNRQSCSEFLCDISEKNILLHWGCLPHANYPSWRTTPGRLSTAAYSIYSQLTSISGRLLPRRKPVGTCHAVVT